MIKKIFIAFTTVTLCFSFAFAFAQTDEEYFTQPGSGPGSQSNSPSSGQGNVGGTGNNPSSDIGGTGRNPGGVDTSLPSPLKDKTLVDLLKRIANFGVAVSIPICTIIILFGAFQIMTAAGNVEKVDTGRKTILYAVIGLAVMLLFDVILLLIKQVLGVKQNF